jgi:hypothetical protein
MGASAEKTASERAGPACAQALAWAVRYDAAGRERLLSSWRCCGLQSCAAAARPRMRGGGGRTAKSAGWLTVCLYSAAMASAAAPCCTSRLRSHSCSSCARMQGGTSPWAWALPEHRTNSVLAHAHTSHLRTEKHQTQPEGTGSPLSATWPRENTGLEAGWKLAGSWLGSAGLEALAWKRWLGSAGLEALAWKRWLGSAGLEALAWKLAWELACKRGAEPTLKARPRSLRLTSAPSVVEISLNERGWPSRRAAKKMHDASTACTRRGAQGARARFAGAGA